MEGWGQSVYLELFISENGALLVRLFYVVKPKPNPDLVGDSSQAAAIFHGPLGAVCFCGALK
ncbi:hypothetical protein VDG1235_3637 [Verrucomicrobiia bacterium DG1235]|nr:hypothetical protein VDG1235_3637 [Verrucomicrobiae bacterium DG1235]